MIGPGAVGFEKEMPSPPPSARRRWLRRLLRPLLVRFLRAPQATIPGRVLVVSTMTVATLAVLSGSRAFYAGLSLAMAVLGVSWIVPWISLRKLTVRRAYPRSVHAGDSYAIRLTVANAKRLVPALGVSVSEVRIARGAARETESCVHFPIIWAGRKTGGTYWTRARARGLHRVPPFEVSTSTPFGVARGRTLFASEGVIRVYPAIGELGRELDDLGDLHAFVRASRRPLVGMAEFFDLARYRPGDPPRLIHWKVAARRGELFVRRFEKPPGSRRVVALDTWVDRRARGISRAFETAVSLAATLCHRLVAAGEPMLLAIGGQPASLHAFRTASPDAYLAPLAEVEPSRKDGLAPLLSRIGPSAGPVHLVTTRPLAAARAALGLSSRGLSSGATARDVRILSTRDPEIDRWFRLGIGRLGPGKSPP